MRFAMQCPLDPMWGYISVQPAHDPYDFCALLRELKVNEEYLNRFYAEYLKCKNFGGYCSVLGTHIPWVIAIHDGTQRARIYSVLVHEAMHLGEQLPPHFGIPFERTTEEVRANIAARVFRIFYDTTERLFPAAPIKQWKSISWLSRAFF